MLILWCIQTARDSRESYVFSLFQSAKVENKARQQNRQISKVHFFQTTRIYWYLIMPNYWRCSLFVSPVKFYLDGVMRFDTLTNVL
jgi:hypothetical protein